MKCYNCGIENVENARFCGKCGTDLESVPSAKAQQQVPPQEKPGELVRCTDDRVLGGVCAGIGRQLNMDSSTVRLLAVLIFVFTASSIGLAYLVLWAVLPERPCAPE
ncbi:MAG: PspC domain-containing protein [Candidatus Heimdallarchaeota archaeon]|nr:PspC domain-containing protein [Candidatus Heimdallarchaeota archaeon]